MAAVLGRQPSVWRARVMAGLTFLLVAVLVTAAVTASGTPALVAAGALVWAGVYYTNRPAGESVRRCRAGGR
jgi:hypothetical protein